MLVLTAVSSINTSRAGSSMPCSRIQRRRARATSARCRSSACRLFFEGDTVSAKETRKRTLAGLNPSLEQLRNRLQQSQVRSLGDQGQDPFRMHFQWRNASPTSLRRGTPALVPALHPSDRRTRTNVEAFCRLAPRHPFHGHDFDHPFPQVTRVGLWHRQPRKENQCPKTRSSITPWESHRFKSVGTRFSG